MEKMNKIMSDFLQDYPIIHAGIKQVTHPHLGRTIHNQTAVSYIRFLRTVNLERLELPVTVYGRSQPSVPTHPAHLMISILDPHTNSWKVVQEVNLPPDEETMGKGLSQNISAEEMESHFKKILSKPPHIIKMNGLETDHLRIECDREHPTWPNHGEANGGIFNVPFGILKPLKCFGSVSDGQLLESSYKPILKRCRINPTAPKGMTLQQTPHAVFFQGKKLSVGFSLMRPYLVHLGWDIMSKGKASQNRLLVSQADFRMIGGLSGPLIRTLTGDYGPHLWTGEISVSENRVIYKNLHYGGTVSLDAVFTVEPDRLILHITQSSEEQIPVLEAEAWRFVWDLKSGMTSNATLPTLREGRNGDVNFPAIIAGDDGIGCLSCNVMDDHEAQTCLQTESYRFSKCRSDGFVLAPFPKPEQPIMIPSGTRNVTIELAVTNLKPEDTEKRAKAAPGLSRAWSSVFTTFRPELGGFSNNAASCNCHVNQWITTDMVVFTKKPKSGPDPLALARFTIERAILDGGGYGYHRNLYLDSDPILVSGVGRIYQLAPDRQWLEHIKPGLVESIQKMLANIGEQGLVVCKDLTGNSGSFRWSTNAMDIIGFGHIDAYVNAWTYRAMLNSTALFKILGENTLAEECQQTAKLIYANYAANLINPDTGWVAGWRSKDGELHDYAFLWVNGVACAFGVLDKMVAHKALTNLECLRREVGPGTAYMGIPFNLLPIHKDDYILSRGMLPLRSTFETYIDGSLSPVGTTYYLRALSIHGFKKEAEQIVDEMDRGYADGIFNGGFDKGVEFRTWDGLPCGYEGTFGLSFGPLYAIAIEKGILKPTEPEWWLSES